MAEGGSASGIGQEPNTPAVEDKAGQTFCSKEPLVEGPSIPECAVCLQTCVHPAQLPCGHIFCFLCVKGVANQSKKCAMCRQEIPSDYLEKPQLMDQTLSEKESSGFDDGYQWFYEGRNGWWMYDERTSSDLEDIYKLGEPSCEMMICGVLYVIDFKANHQYRKHDPRKKRRIKRDIKSASKKGVAGLRKEYKANKK